MNGLTTEALALFNYTRALRRDFHQHPELGFHEVRTAGIVARELAALGMEVRTGVAQTGVVALLVGEKPGPVVLLRFDMDALPIQEETGAEYSSCFPGLMHGCGHDAHTAIGLAVARLLSERKNEISGTVKFMFQPAEEGMGGAPLMIEDGVLDNPKPDFALAMHVWNDCPVGWLGISQGPVMAAAETLHVRVIGKGGHGASPHQAVDPVLATAHIITALQGVVARNVAPLSTAVVSVTTVHGGEAFNVIPKQVEFRGTIRSFDPGVRERTLQRVRQVIEGVAASMECKTEIELQSITPAVVNDASVTLKVQNVAARLYPDSEIATRYQTMGSEDMAFVLQRIPGCFFFVGSANHEKGLDAPHHHPRFDVDEQVLPRAAAIMAGAALESLRG
ncbi:MAG TPA: amidohydrolase [Anaerolineales bacterium]|nr:amidohydrolase [Anaerolineales bacterium]